MKKTVLSLSVFGIGVILLATSIGSNLNASVNEKEGTTEMPSFESFGSQASQVSSGKTLENETMDSFESEGSVNSLSSDINSIYEEETKEEINQNSSDSETTSTAIENTVTETTYTESDISIESAITTESGDLMESKESQTETSSIQENEKITSSEDKDLTSSTEASESVTSSEEESKTRKPSIILSTSPKLPTFSEIIANDFSSVSEEYRVNQVGEDDLAGFELPLLNSYKEVNQGVIVYEALKQVQVDFKEEWSNPLLVKRLYQSLFGIKIEDLAMLEVMEDDMTPGDIFYLEVEEEQQLFGLYLGENYYISIEKKIDLKGKEYQVPAINKLVLKKQEKIQVRRQSQHPLTSYGKSVLLDYPVSFDFQANFVTERFIQSIGEEARQLGLEYDIFASVMIAQAVLESGGGTSGLASSPYHNLFGIKGSYQNRSVVLSTKEDRGNGELYEIKAAFRSYPNYHSALSDYVQLIRGGVSGNATFYQKSWRSEAKNYLSATHALTGKYATDAYYNNKLNSIIAAYHLTKYDEPVNENPGIFIQHLSSIPEEYRSLMSYPTYNGKDYNSSGSYPVGQCTWYAFNRVSQLGMTVDDFMGNGGEWGESGKRLGYQVSSTPEPGTLISFSPGTAGSDIRYGHVAFVEAVGPNGILISEGNVFGGQTISYRIISNELAHSSLVSYITPKR
ncbi:glucosaminidase domain-containing protein [Enterococcus sp. LJL98]